MEKIDEPFNYHDLVHFAYNALNMFSNSVGS